MEQIKGDKNEAACPITVVSHKAKVKCIYKLLNACIPNPEGIRFAPVIKIICKLDPICIIPNQWYDITTYA